MHSQVRTAAALPAIEADPGDEAAPDEPACAAGPSTSGAANGTASGASSSGPAARSPSKPGTLTLFGAKRPKSGQAGLAGSAGGAAQPASSTGGTASAAAAAARPAQSLLPPVAGLGPGSALAAAASAPSTLPSAGPADALAALQVFAAEGQEGRGDADAGEEGGTGVAHSPTVLVQPHAESSNDLFAAGGGQAGPLAGGSIDPCGGGPVDLHAGLDEQAGLR